MVNGWIFQGQPGVDMSAQLREQGVGKTRAWKLVSTEYSPATVSWFQSHWAKL